MNMFNFVHQMTFLTVVSLKMRCKDTTFCRIMQTFRDFFVILHPNLSI